MDRDLDAKHYCVTTTTCLGKIHTKLMRWNLITLSFQNKRNNMSLTLTARLWSPWTSGLCFHEETVPSEFTPPLPRHVSVLVPHNNIGHELIWSSRSEEKKIQLLTTPKPALKWFGDPFEWGLIPYYDSLFICVFVVLVIIRWRAPRCDAVIARCPVWKHGGENGDMCPATKSYKSLP